LLIKIVIFPLGYSEGEKVRDIRGTNDPGVRSSGPSANEITENKGAKNT
jgi:hypothetical protein